MQPSLRRFLGINRFVLSPQEYKRVLLTGQLNLIFIVVLVAFTIMDLIWGYRYPIPFNLAAIMGGIIVYILSRKGLFLSSRVLLAVIVNAITLYFTAVLDRTMGLFQFAICINVGIMAAFGYENLKLALLMVAVGTILYLVALFHPLPRIARVDLADPVYLDRNLFFGFLTASAASTMVVYYLLRTNNESEEMLLEKERSISVKNNELKEVNAELDKFFYSVSHDLRAPLTSLQGLLNLVETAENPKQLQEYIAMLRGRVDNLDQFVKSITAYASNSRQAIVHEPISLRSIFREVLENIRFYPNADGISITLDIPGQQEFRSDPTRLQIIFGNLVANAVKHHDPKKQHPFIKITQELTIDHLTIIIEDNGIGIREEVLPRIFEMFYRGNEHSQGSGLGLFIVKEAVDKLHGTIAVRSVYGQGSTFAVRLPLNGAATVDPVA